MASFSEFQTRLARWFNPRARLAVPAYGLYHYLRESADGKMRLHLRLEPDGRGLLMANAARAYHLNPSAALMAYLHLEGHPPQEALRILSGWFAASPNQLRADYGDLCEQIEQIGDPAGGCPLCEMDLEMEMPFSSKPSAPYRMDCALTYRCNNDGTHCYNVRSRAPQEMTTAEWKQTLDHLWKIGVPHIVFTGGEPTLRPDLPELIAHAERNGQITGMNTNGRRLKDPAFVQALVDAGLDHVQITLESHDEAIHDHLVAHPGAWRETVAGLRNALASRLFVMTNTTLLRENSPHLAETMRFLGDLRVPTVGFNALIYSGRGVSVGTGLHESDLPPLLDIVRDATDRSGQRLIWYTPTQYCHFDPLEADLGLKGCTAARYAMCTEPDGSVLPCQSYYTPLGHILRDSWDSIWNHDLALSLRERRNLDAACRSCELLETCGGGCPLAYQANPDLRPHPLNTLQSEVR